MYGISFALHFTFFTISAKNVSASLDSPSSPFVFDVDESKSISDTHNEKTIYNAREKKHTFFIAQLAIPLMTLGDLPVATVWECPKGKLSAASVVQSYAGFRVPSGPVGRGTVCIHRHAWSFRCANVYVQRGFPSFFAPSAPHPPRCCTFSTTTSRCLLAPC